MFTFNKHSVGLNKNEGLTVYLLDLQIISDDSMKSICVIFFVWMKKRFLRFFQKTIKLQITSKY